MMLETRTFKQPKEHILFKSAWNSVNYINTEFQLRNLEQDIDQLDKYILSCKKRRDELEAQRKKCVSWRLKHTCIR